MIFEPSTGDSGFTSGGLHSIVATQTCDLLHPSSRAEPYVELLHGQVVDGVVPADNGKSFREFSVALDGNAPSFLRVRLHDRAFVAREDFILRAIPFEKQPSFAEQHRFSRWLGERYTRTAYPDAFVYALKCVDGDGSKRIEKALRPLACCRGLFFALNNWGECDPAIYKVTAVLVLDSRGKLNEQDMTDAEASFGKICAILDEAGFDVTDSCSVESISELTVEDFILLSKWQLDYLTIRDQSGKHSDPLSGDG